MLLDAVATNYKANNLLVFATWQEKYSNKFFPNLQMVLHLKIFCRG